jgi:hypothetical protein
MYYSSSWNSNFDIRYHLFLASAYAASMQQAVASQVLDELYSKNWELGEKSIIISNNQLML